MQVQNLTIKLQQDLCNFHAIFATERVLDTNVTLVLSCTVSDHPSMFHL